MWIMHGVLGTVTLCLLAFLVQTCRGKLSCPEGWCSLNDVCDVPVESLTCRHGRTSCNDRGDCVQFGDDILCLCDEQYAGSQCQWTSQPFQADFYNCNNSGVCFMYVGNTSKCARCSCRPGFYGRWCERQTRTYTYEPDVCQNGGTSYRYGHSLGCVCPCGYIGTHCDMKYTRNKEAKCASVTIEVCAGACKLNSSCVLDNFCRPICITDAQSVENDSSSGSPLKAILTPIIFLLILIPCAIAVFATFSWRKRKAMARRGMREEVCDSNTATEEICEQPPRYEDVCKPPSYDEVLQSSPYISTYL